MKKIVLSLVLLSLFALDSYALSVKTHQAINENIAKNSLNGFSLDTYLKGQLGMQNGVNEVLKSSSIWTKDKTVLGWLGYGGLYEDEPPGFVIPYIRSNRHFHDPLLPIEQAGFSGIWPPIPGITKGKSAILWSQSALNTQSPGGYYSWYDVRNFFYTALTASDINTRSTNFADTFRGLGQLMHLVQDMSVPEHTEERSQRI